jgi:hypothetical protein
VPRYRDFETSLIRINDFETVRPDWGGLEIAALLEHLGNHISGKTPPSPSHCPLLKQNYPSPRVNTDRGRSSLGIALLGYHLEFMVFSIVSETFGWVFFSTQMMPFLPRLS